MLPNRTHRTPNLCRQKLIGWSLCLATLLTLGTDSASGQDAADTPPLPLKRVVLFSSSVGFFEHQGEIEGDRQIEFAFKRSDINDLLKSLVVRDRDGGLVTAVNYGSPEPLTKTLRTFAIDLTQAPSLAQIFQQLRGHKVRLESPGDIRGAVVGVETRKAPPGSATADIEVLHLRTESGLQSVRIENILRTQFVDAKIDREFQQALDLLASVRANDQKRVKLDFRGAGKRHVSVGYIQEAPVWKTSYRLVLKDGEQPFLQGWAIVENTTAQDWRDVQLTLVSGRPISFLTDLYQPLFMARPLVTPQQHASLRPRVYDQDLAGRNQEFAAVAARAAAGAPGGTFGAGRGRSGGMGGGMMGGMGGGMGGMSANASDPFAPPGSAKGASRPFVTTVIPADRDELLDLKQGVAAAANADDVGELFRYVITAPVTLNRSESAMLPIVNDAVKGEKVDIYNPAVHAKHPLAGLRLTNSTPLHLLQGPITLFDGGEYAGDARIEDIPPASTRLISYALDLQTEVAVENRPEKIAVAELKISKGGLHIKHKASRQQQYVVKNSSEHAKQVIVERPIDTTWKILQPAPTEKTRALHRFTVTAQPGKPTMLEIAEEQDVKEEFLIADLETEKLVLYLRMPIASPALKQALQGVIDRRTAAIEKGNVRQAAEKHLAELVTDQERVRRNLQAIPEVKITDPDAEVSRKTVRDLVQRYLTKLAELENAVEKQRDRIDELKRQETQAQQEQAAFLQALVVE